MDFKNLRVLLKAGRVDEAGAVVTPEVAVRYGAFVNTVIEFVIVAFSVFVIVKFMNALIRKRETPKL